MKVILTGENGYISNNCCDFLTERGIDACCISLKQGSDSIDFKGVDAVIHCAAIVHKKEKDHKDEYEKINYELAKETADKALKEGVKHFVFMSTMAVYGKEQGEINRDTPLKPVTLYGRSKLKAEEYIYNLKSKYFNVSIIRPPMVYGKGCPGNYQKLSMIAKKLPLIPDTQNKKSLIYIENLCSVIYSILKENKGGVYMPMDNVYISTGELMSMISGKRRSRLLGLFVKIMPFGIAKKAFGTLYYGEDIACKADLVSVKDAVRSSEK